MLHVSKSEQKRSYGYLISLILLNKITIFANAYYDDIWSQEIFWILLISFLAVELFLLTQYNNFTLDSVEFWKYGLIVYFLINMGTLLRYQMEYYQDW